MLAFEIRSRDEIEAEIRYNIDVDYAIDILKIIDEQASHNEDKTIFVLKNETYNFHCVMEEIFNMVDEPFLAEIYMTLENGFNCIYEENGDTFKIFKEE